MNKYEITFMMDVEDALEYDDSEQSAEISYIDDDCFMETFDTPKKIKEFEDWYNADESDSNKISIENIIYDSDGEGQASLEVITKEPLQDENDFATIIVDYLFDGDYPYVHYHVTGTSYEDYWDYDRESPEQRTVEVDYDTSNSIHSYSNVTISKVE